jgi:hypothetical protein
MRDRNAGHGSSESTAKGAGRVALDDDQLRTLDLQSDATRDLSHMGVRIG